MPRLAEHGRAPRWDALYEKAAGQAGYFTLAEANEAGYSSQLLTYYLEIGRVERWARGIFRLVHFPASDREDLVPAGDPGPECTPSAVSGSVMLRQRRTAAPRARGAVSGTRRVRLAFRRRGPAERPLRVLGAPAARSSPARLRPRGRPCGGVSDWAVVGVVWCWLLRACGVAGL